MTIYKSIVGGKVFTTNNNGTIEVLTKGEMEKKIHESWWQKKLRYIKEL